MGSHPINLALRFLLEMSALFAMGRWGLGLRPGPWRYVLMIAVPAVAMIAWGVFSVPGDPSRSGGAPIPVPGLVRLLLELCFFGLATLALYATDARLPALVFGALVVLHYALSYDRLSWLIRR